MIYTSHYFDKEIYEHKIDALLVQISNSAPANFEVDMVLKNLSPDWKWVRALKEDEITWEKFEYEYNKKMDKELTDEVMHVLSVEDCVLLCWEHTPELCHRRLLGERLQKMGMEVIIK